MHPCCFNNLCVFLITSLWCDYCIEISYKIIFRWWDGNREKLFEWKVRFFMVAWKSHRFNKVLFLSGQDFFFFWSFAFNFSRNLFAISLFVFFGLWNCGNTALFSTLNSWNSKYIHALFKLKIDKTWLQKINSRSFVVFEIGVRQFFAAFYTDWVFWLGVVCDLVIQ